MVEEEETVVPTPSPGYGLEAINFTSRLERSSRIDIDCWFFLCSRFAFPLAFRAQCSALFVSFFVRSFVCSYVRLLVCLFFMFVCLLVGWLIGWLAGRLVDWLVGWLVGRSVGRLVGWLVGPVRTGHHYHSPMHSTSDMIISTKTECDYLNGWIKKRSHTQKSHPKVVNPRDIAGERQKKKKKKKKDMIMCVAAAQRETDWCKAA